MAATTALVVRRPSGSSSTSLPRRRASRGSSKGNQLTTRQVLLGFTGAFASAAATAGLVTYGKMRPMTAGATVGVVSGVGAAFATGPMMRPLVTGAAIGGVSIAAASWIGHLAHVPPPPDPNTKDPAKTPTADATKAAGEMPSGARPELVAGVPPGVQNANPSTNAAPAPRQASSITAQMRAQIRQAMETTNFPRR